MEGLLAHFWPIYDQWGPHPRVRSGFINYFIVICIINHQLIYLHVFVENRMWLSSSPKFCFGGVRLASSLKPSRTSGRFLYRGAPCAGCEDSRNITNKSVENDDNITMKKYRIVMGKSYIIIYIYIIYLLAVLIYYIDILEITWWYLALSGNGGTPSCGLFLRGGKPMQGLQDRNHVYCLVDLRPVVDAILVYESSCNCGGHSLGDPFME